MKIDPPFELDPNVKVRTLFCPKPDRLSARGWRTYSSFYSWLFAKHNNGEFVLCIEDTDLERSTPEAAWQQSLKGWRVKPCLGAWSILSDQTL